MAISTMWLFCAPHRLTGLSSTSDWLLLFLVLLACYTMAKQQTFASMLTLKNKFYAVAFLSAGHALQITLGSCTVRSMRGLPDWQYYLSYITQPRYASSYLQEQIFLEYKDVNLRSVVGSRGNCFSSSFSPGCRYLNGTHYLYDRYYTHSVDRDDVNTYLNFGICWAFPAVVFLFSLVVYALPLPTLVKQKFRDWPTKLLTRNNGLELIYICLIYYLQNDKIMQHDCNANWN